LVKIYIKNLQKSVKNNQKGSVWAVGIIVIVMGVAIYFYPKQIPESAISTQTQLTTQQISEKEVIGSWSSSIDGEESMSFYIDDENNKMYHSYSDDRLYVTGTWVLDNGKLTVNFLSDILPKTMIFTSVSRKGNILTLMNTQGEISTHTLIGE
jgi:hypothetical protein